MEDLALLTNEIYRNVLYNLPDNCIIIYVGGKKHFDKSSVICIEMLTPDIFDKYSIACDL